MLGIFVGPILCLLLYACGIAHGTAPLIASMLFSAFLFGALSTKGKQATLFFIFAGLVFLILGFGLVPGFTRINLGGASIASGKALAGLSAMAAFPSKWAWNSRCSMIAVACLVGVPSLAWYIGYIHWTPATPHALVVFAIANIFSTTSEEWFFRRWVQQPLQRFGAVPSLVITAILFGLVHFASGHIFMMLAAIAGLAYASVYRVSGGSIWAAVVLHWTLNVLRIALFGL
ncbi:MAG: CPBP family intramembrane glutamic endopeptidase [Pseudomonadota bacterium]